MSKFNYLINTLTLDDLTSFLLINSVSWLIDLEVPPFTKSKDVRIKSLI